jgi:hypothetical protein
LFWFLEVLIDSFVARIVKRRNSCKTLIKKPERKRSLGRPRRGWRMIIIEFVLGNRVGCCGLDLSGSG